MGLILVNGYENNNKMDEYLVQPGTAINKIADYFRQHGYIMKPFEDGDDPTQADMILFTEMPVDRWSNYKYFKQCCQAGCQGKMVVWLLESPTHFPWVWKDQNLHKQFAKILTWNDFLVDGNRYIKIYYGQAWQMSPKFDNPFEHRKLLTLIAANKMIEHPFELFSERREAIRAFERLCPYDFDLYGQFWNQPTSGIWWNPKIAERQYPFLAPQFPSAKGSCADKIDTLTGYKFCICYENMISSQHFSGYITEKIFDCFFAGCIPIYLGDLNIAKVIPADLYIHRANFNSYEQLYGYIVNMSPSIWQGYRQRIKDYLNSELFRNTFSEQRFLETNISVMSKIMES